MVDPSSREFNAVRVHRNGRGVQYLPADSVVELIKQKLRAHQNVPSAAAKDIGETVLPAWMRGDPRIVHEVVVKRALSVLSDMHVRGLLNHVYLRVSQELAEWDMGITDRKIEDALSVYRQLMEAQSIVEVSSIAGARLSTLAAREEREQKEQREWKEQRERR